MTILNPKRSVFDLTEEECQTVFALAFGFAPPLDHLIIHPLLELTIIGQAHSIILYPDGQFYASRFSNEQEETVCFNAWKVVTYLGSLNVQFGVTSTPAEQ